MTTFRPTRRLRDLGLKSPTASRASERPSANVELLGSMKGSFRTRPRPCQPSRWRRQLARSCGKRRPVHPSPAYRLSVLRAGLLTQRSGLPRRSLDRHASRSPGLPWPGRRRSHSSLAWLARRIGRISCRGGSTRYAASLAGSQRPLSSRVVRASEVEFGSPSPKAAEPHPRFTVRSSVARDSCRNELPCAP
jgi:hypothetical protein